MRLIQWLYLTDQRMSLTVIHVSILWSLGVSVAFLLPRPISDANIVLIALLAGILCLLRLGAWLGLIGLGLAFALGQVNSRLARQLPLALEDRVFSVVGFIDDLPKHEKRRTLLRLRIDKTAAQDQALRGRLIALAWYGNAPSHFDPLPTRYRLRAGAHWQLCVRLRTPRGVINPGGKDREREALADNVAATGVVCQRPLSRQIDPARGIDAWREHMAWRIDQGCQSPFFRFVKSFAIGDTRALTPSDWQVLRQAGLTHLIAISGSHVCFVANLLGYGVALIWSIFPTLGRVLPRPISCQLATALAAIGYAVLTGLSLPTVRTVMMMVIFTLAHALGRYPPGNAVFTLALGLLLFMSPFSILTAGFWLSFSGVAWLMWVLRAKRQAKWVELVTAQWVVTLGLLPISLFLFGTLSSVGPFLNLLMIPWWSCTVIPLAVIGTVLEMINPSLGQLCWHWAAQWFGYSWQLICWVCQLPWANVWLPQPSLGVTLLAIAGAAWLLMPRKTQAKLWAAVLWLPLLWPSRRVPETGNLRVIVFDVGQGLSVFVQTAQHALLYDAGPAGQGGFNAGEQIVVPALHALGVRHLDRIVISHADADHAGGRMAVATAYAWPSLLQLAPPNAPLPQTTPCATGQRWRWEGVRFEFLLPLAGSAYAGNRSSCVLMVSVGRATVLLPGDIDQTVENQLLMYCPPFRRASVVIAPHHGSKTSSSDSLVKALRASLVVVSAGYHNRYGHPHVDVLRRWHDSGAHVCQTVNTGALEIWLGPHLLRYEAFRHQRARLWDIVERQRTNGILCD